MALHQQGQFVDAEKAYSAALNADPQNPDIMALLGTVLSELKKHGPAIEYIEKALSIDPNAALFHFHHGNALDKAARYSEAESAFQRAVQLQPQWAEAWYNLGNAQRHGNKLDAALGSYQKALALNPAHILAQNNTAQVLMKKQDLAGARRTVDAALQMAPDHLQLLFTKNDIAFEQNDLPAAFVAARRVAEIRLNLPAGDIVKFLNSDDGLKKYDDDTLNALLALAASAVLQQQSDLALSIVRLLLAHEPDMEEALSLYGSIALANNRFGAADDSYGQAFMLDPSFVTAPWNRSMVMLVKGNLAEGFRRYRWRWSALEKFKNLRLNAPMWDGRDLKGKTILVHEEQGFGDSLQMLRFIPALKARGAKVWYYARAPLYALLENWHGADKVLLWDIKNRDVPAGVDFAVGGMDLPGLLGLNINTLSAGGAYLPNPKKDLAEYQLPKGGFKVGLVWSGNPQHKRDHERSVPLATLKPLLATPGVQFFSLQYKAKDADLQLMREYNVTDLAPRIQNLADTAAFLEQLDLLITVDSAPAHLAGALGVKVWTLVTLSPDWRWLMNRDDSPWYPSLRLFRQENLGNWPQVVEKVKQALGTEMAISA